MSKQRRQRREAARSPERGTFTLTVPEDVAGLIYLVLEEYYKRNPMNPLLEIGVLLPGLTVGNLIMAPDWVEICHRYLGEK